jgi:tetraacyldisaccharide 4'-kinase
MARVLAPVGLIYGTLSAQRMLRRPLHIANVPVVCVGNFTAGGTGKTPFVRTLLGLLRQQGHVPVVLSRGYGGTKAGPHWVNVTTDAASAVGDEPLLLAADAPVVVARDRVAGALSIEHADNGPRATVIVMDDGLQNPALAKILSFSVVDGARGFGNGRCMPAGPLRAPLAAQLPRVQAIILNAGARTAGAPLCGLPDVIGVPVLSGGVNVSGPVEWLKSKPVLAYAGIGVPERFFQSLRAAGGDVADTMVFPDHHDFTEADAQRLLGRVTGTSLQLVTTEKDAIRLCRANGARGALAAASRILPVAFEFDATNSALLGQLIAEHVPLRA